MKYKIASSLIASVVLIAFGMSGLAQREDPPAPGVLDGVRRDFVAASPELVGLVVVITRVAQFDTAAHAHDAIDQWFVDRTDAEDNALDFSGLSPVGVQPIQDETRALAGAVLDEDGDDFASALLAVRDESFLYTFETFRGTGSALDDATLIAKRLFGLEPQEVSAVPGADYRTGGLWDRLPRLEDLPQGFVLDDEIELCVGTFATYECAQATPEASTGGTPPSTSAQLGLSRQSPLVYGTVGRVGEYDVRVITTIPDATSTVLAENTFNEPTQAGHQFYLARVEVTYRGPSSDDPLYGLEFQAVGNLNRGYDESRADCGVAPDSASDVGELFSGGTAQFNVCWQVSSEDTESLVMYVDPNFGEPEERVWFSLDPPQGATPEASPVSTAG